MKRLLIVALVISMLSACGVEVVDTGHRGIKTTFGKVQGEPLQEGLYFFNPFTSAIIEIDTRVQRLDAEGEAYTKDVQQAKLTYTVNYRMEQAAAGAIYANYGREWEQKLIPQVVAGTLKDVIGKWDAVDLIGNRDKARHAAEASIVANLAPKGVTVSRFEITDLAYTDQFEHAVEAKVVAQQKAIEEHNRTVQIDEQAKQKVISATAEAESMRIRANALERNPKLVEWEAVQKWDGKLPVYQLGGAMPFINLPTR